MLKAKTTHHKSPTAKTRYLIIPSSIAGDSQYPLKNGYVTVEIVGDKLVVSNL